MILKSDVYHSCREIRKFIGWRMDSKTGNMSNDIWIQLTFNSYGNFEGKDELIEELRKVCVVQERKKWYPAACTGAEFFATLNFNLSFTAFLNNVIIPNVVFLAFIVACKAIWKAASSFLKKNKGFELQTLTLTFNDATIVVNETLENHYGFLVRLFQSLPKHWAKLQELGLKNIDMIELPVLHTDASVELLEKYCSEEGETPENCLWLISYELGLEHCYYSPAMMKVVWP
jgi:hypothetical protein